MKKELSKCCNAGKIESNDLEVALGVPKFYCSNCGNDFKDGGEDLLDKIPKQDDDISR